MIPVAVGRTADAVRHIPDSGLVHRLTKGRAWIALLGVMLAGIVAINVASLSFTASTGQMEQRAVTLEQENSALRAALARRLSNDRIEASAMGVGMIRPGTDEYAYRSAGAGDVGVAIDRLSGLSSTTPTLGASSTVAE